MTHLENLMPEMLYGKDLIDKLSILPEYNPDIRNKSQTERLIALSNVFDVYVPNKMSVETYNKLYISLVRSLQKKTEKIAVKQKYLNYNIMTGQSSSGGIIGGSDSFSIIGTSGIGKSSSINRAISIITQNKLIEVDKPRTKIIPCLIIQCPFDCSVKGMLLAILQQVDMILGSEYYHEATSRRGVTTDVLIGSVSQIALNHIGLLIVDEIQNVITCKAGRSLVNALTQLINNSGISICMVGTPECSYFFEQAMQLARRSLGIRCTALKNDEYFENLCETLYKYQYVKNKTQLDDATTKWLYSHSLGVISIVTSLIHDAQEIAILNGIEILNIETLEIAFKERMQNMRMYINPPCTSAPKSVSRRRTQKKSAISVSNSYPNTPLVDLLKQAKAYNKDIVELIKENYTVEEVSI